MLRAIFCVQLGTLGFLAKFCHTQISTRDMQKVFLVETDAFQPKT
jgi:hypothetical protein